MQLQCPCCGEQFPIEAGFADADGKKLAAMLAGLDPKFGRAVLNYLRLFSPPKRGLRTATSSRASAQRLMMRPKPASIGRGAGGSRIQPSSMERHPALGVDAAGAAHADGASSSSGRASRIDRMRMRL